MLQHVGLPPIRLHDARHSAATLLIRAGAPLKDAQELLGHSSIAITADIYNHMLDDARRAAGVKLAAHLGRAQGGAHGQPHGQEGGPTS